ncbi:MAG: SAP domain-containing protein [Halobacteriales archaeon]|nr:SAP domain-containing protein [Halobacteriales archaeon]
MHATRRSDGFEVEVTFDPHSNTYTQYVDGEPAGQVWRGDWFRANFTIDDDRTHAPANEAGESPFFDGEINLTAGGEGEIKFYESDGEPVTDDGLEDLNNDDLREMLRSRDMKVSGNKDELVARLRGEEDQA